MLRRQRGRSGLGGEARHELLGKIAALVVGQCERVREHFASTFGHS
ncbi:MAG: hypothetical protein ABIY55_30480 [Kofleriaceae bacterium]